MLDVISCLLEQGEYLITFTKVTTRVKMNVLVLNFGRWIVLGEPHVEELDG